MRKRDFIILLLALLPLAARSQSVSMHMLADGDQTWYNPTYVMDRDTIHHYRVSLWGRYRLEDIDLAGDAPMDIEANFQTRIKGHENWFAQGGFIYDGYSFFNQYTLFAGFGYQWQWGVHKLRVGGRAMLNVNQMLLDQLTYSDPRLRKVYVVPDLDIGIEYSNNILSVGLAAKNLIGLKVGPKDATILTYERKMFVDLAYFVRYPKGFSLTPRILIGLGEHSIGLDVGLEAQLWQYMRLGYVFRSCEVRHMFLLGAQMPGGFQLDVTWDFAHHTKRSRTEETSGANQTPLGMHLEANLIYNF